MITGVFSITDYQIHVICPCRVIYKAIETYKNERAPKDRSPSETEGEGGSEVEGEGEGDLKRAVSVTVLNETEINMELVNKESEDISVKVEETPIEV